MAYYWCSLTFDKVGTLLERNSIVYGETEQEFIRKCPYKQIISAVRYDIDRIYRKGMV